MQAVVLDRYGTPDVLKLKDVARPTPGTHEVLVRVHAASINDWDWGLLRGTSPVIRMLHGLFRPKVKILGGDLAGRVEEVGAGVKSFRPGDEVYGDLCMNMLRALGADRVIDYLQEDFTGPGARYDLILDTKTTRSPFACARALVPGGVYATVGGSTPRLLQVLALGPLILRVSNKHLRLVTLKPNKDLGYMNQLFEAGTLTPVIDGPYELANVAEAFRHFGTGNHQGKIVVSMT